MITAHSKKLLSPHILRNLNWTLQIKNCPDQEAKPIPIPGKSWNS